MLISREVDQRPVRRVPSRVRPAGIPRSGTHRPILHVLGRILAFGAWTMLAWTAVLALPPLGGGLVAATLTGALVWGYLLRAGPARRRDRATLRLRGPRSATPWLCATVPVWLLFNHSLATVHSHWAGSPPAAMGPLEELAREPMAWLPLGVMALVFAPLSEEIFFRGYVQRALERRLGAGVGILLGAALFAAVHLEPWRFGFLLAGGIVLGAFVLAARSLWAGVGLHASANGSLALLDASGTVIPAPTWRVGFDPGAAGDHLLLLFWVSLLIVLYGRVRRSARTGRPRALRPALAAAGPRFGLRASPGRSP